MAKHYARESLVANAVTLLICHAPCLLSLYQGISSREHFVLSLALKSWFGWAN